MTTSPPPQESNWPAYRTNRPGYESLEEAIETWKVDAKLRSYRKTGKAVHAHYLTVRDRVQRVHAALESGELEYINGEIRPRQDAV